MSGYESYSETGKLQFNSEFPTYSLRASGTTYSENRKVGNTSPRSFILPYLNLNMPLIAIGGGVGYAAAFAGFYYTQDGLPHNIYATDAPAGVAFTFYAYTPTTNVPPASFGLEVRNTAGQIVFSSNQRVFKAFEKIGVEQTVSHSGKTLAYCGAAWAGHRIAGPLITSGNGGPIGDGEPIGDDPSSGTTYGYQNDGKIYGGRLLDGGQTVAGAMLTYDDVYFGPGPDPYQPPNYVKPLNLFVVDVTNYPIGGTFF